MNIISEENTPELLQTKINNLKEMDKNNEIIDIKNDGKELTVTLICDPKHKPVQYLA